MPESPWREAFRDHLRSRVYRDAAHLGGDPFDLFAGTDEPEPQRDPSPEELTAAVPRLRRVLDEYRTAGKLKEAIRFWKDRSDELDRPLRGKAAIVLKGALASMSEGDAP